MYGDITKNKLINDGKIIFIDIGEYSILPNKVYLFEYTFVSLVLQSLRLLSTHMQLVL